MAKTKKDEPVTEPVKSERELAREAREALEAREQERAAERAKRDAEIAERCKKTWAEWEARGWK